MDTITKWKLGEKLNNDETIVVLTELFEGTGKRFCFNATTKIDQQLYKIYEKFPKSENTNWILKFSSTQSERPFVSFENFECLKKKGCFMALKKDELDKKEEELVSNTKGVNEVKQVLECKLKLDFTFFKPMESINYIIEDLANKYGTKPEKIACGEINGNKVWALMLGGEIASPIGWMEKKISFDMDKSNTRSETESELDTVTHGSEINSVDYELIDFKNIKIDKA